MMLNRRIVNICQRVPISYSLVQHKVLVRRKHAEVKKNDSFVFNIFRGNVDTTQVLPYPQVLNEEQTELLKLLLDQAERVITQINDPLLNDELGHVPDSTLDALKSYGAYGLQVPEEYGGAGLNSTQYGRLTEVIGRDT